ncbi:MAG TPA: DUF3293 domain-containing protein [Rhodanobacteraceae bacterium]|nr:DUF3293 domain-containing protein [Rhodanobacteraceae bacterium]
MSALAIDTAERVNALIALYRESHYDVEMPRGGAATLRIGAAAPAAVKRWIGSDGVAFYLTACNPRSASLTKMENDARLETLRAEMRARGCRCLEGAGHIPGEAWREECLLVAGIDIGEADEIARRHEQNSIVVVPAKAPVALRIYRPDWRAVAGDGADLEWA